MTGTIYAQVSEWLDLHASEWSAPHRVVLREQWRVCSRTFGDESPPACGALLALVREAWGDPNLYLAIIDCSPAHSSRVFLRWTVFKPAIHGSIVGLYESEVEALAAALIGAPTKGDGR